MRYFYMFLVWSFTELQCLHREQKEDKSGQRWDSDAHYSWVSLKFSNIVTAMAQQRLAAASLNTHDRDGMDIIQLNCASKFKRETQW